MSLGSATSGRATANQPYPDTGGQAASPNYPIQSIITGVPTPQPSAGFQDFPNRDPQAALVVNWQAELGLAIENPTTHVATILGTFTWGFIVQAVDPTKATIANYIPIQPYSSNQGAGGPMSGASSGYLSTLTTDFDGNKHRTVTSTKWTFNTPGTRAASVSLRSPSPAHGSWRSRPSDSSRSGKWHAGAASRGRPGNRPRSHRMRIRRIPTALARPRSCPVSGAR